MVEDRLEVTDRHSAGCAPSTPERACFLAPVCKTGYAELSITGFMLSCGLC